MTDVASDIMLQWISCNIYTMWYTIFIQYLYSVVNKLEAIIETYKNLKKHPLAKRGKTLYMKFKQFHEKCEQLFDISCGDESCRKKQETLQNVKQTRRI